MGTVFLHGNGGGGGSGGGFGLQVVGNPKPKNPVEGIVWVNTDVDITGCFMSAEQPENPTAGMLWIKISDSSSIKVGTPLGKDYITIMLNSVRQYVGGAWVSVEAKSFQNGVWVNWWDGTLYDTGDQWHQYTGGWKSVNEGALDATYGAEQITIVQTGGSGLNIVLYTEQKVDVTRFSWLVAEVTNVSFPASWNGQGVKVGLASTNTSFVHEDIDVAISYENKTGNFAIKVNIANVKGECFPAIAFLVATGNIKKVYLTNEVV